MNIAHEWANYLEELASWGAEMDKHREGTFDQHVLDHEAHTRRCTHNVKPGELCWEGNCCPF